MTMFLGLDIGTNSVGSAWVDTERKQVRVGVSVFPAGVEEKDEGRGAPKNQSRRQKRSLRRSLARRSARKRKLRSFLVEHGLLPANHNELQALFATDPWYLRRKGLEEPLNAAEFGRVLLHLCQRRGALGLKPSGVDENSDASEDNQKEVRKKKTDDSESDSEGLVKAAVETTKRALAERNARTFGELMAILADERRAPVLDNYGQPKRDEAGKAVTYSHRIRNEKDRFEFHADRAMLRDEFDKLWEKQASFDSPLAKILTSGLRQQLDDPIGNNIWRHGGLLFGQRRTYWDTGTLGRCDLEPTDQCVSIADRHASYFRVLETANNIRIRGPHDQDFRPLTTPERAKVIARLQAQKTGTIEAIRAALGIDKKSLKKQDLPERSYALNLERDEEREINTDWFHREIVMKSVEQQTWDAWEESKREGLNRALLRFDPALDADRLRMRAIVSKIGLDEVRSERLLAAWQTRPKLERRLKLSRRAVVNLIPYMEEATADGHWRTQIEARRAFAKDAGAWDRLANAPVTAEQRYRYLLGGNRINKRDRHYLKRHPELVLPPAPMLSNPVVRKAIHEVRRHVIAHIRAEKGKKPDRIVIEFARETTKSAKLSDEILFRNRRREQIRRRIREEIIRPVFGAHYDFLSHNQLRAAEDRVILCVQQRGVCAYSLDKLNLIDHGPCAYSGRAITLRQAALGDDLEVDHIIPYSRCGNNSLSNRVLCYRDSNRNKSNQTPREWWGDKFDERIAPMRFMDGHQPDKKADFFTKRDYAAKWRNLSRQDVSTEWKGSQLSDTAYAAKEVQAYLEQALWPNEPTHLAEGASRRVFVTKGAYTSLLRRNWQLYQRIWSEAGPSREEQQRASAKDRGDHREHAIDAVAIAVTDPARILELARLVKLREEEWGKAKAQDRKPEKFKRSPLATPWGSIKSFRRQVLALVYETFDDAHDSAARASAQPGPIVVCHRAVGRKLTGKLHEETLFGAVPVNKTLYTGHKPVGELEPNHLRLPVPEKPNDAIARLAASYQQQGIDQDSKRARKRAKATVKSAGYVPKPVDPPPGKSGLVRDIGLRRVLRDVINQRLQQLGIDKNADTFLTKDMKRILKETGPLTMPSGVPIKRVVLLRTMNNPVVIPRKQWDDVAKEWKSDEAPRSARAYLGGNNHHIEIREDEKGNWAGDIVPTFTAAVRARIEKRNPVDCADDAERGGRFMMSLSEGETVYMRHKETGEPGYFVVFKLDKPQTIQFKHHWDARRAKGEKDESGNLIPDSERDAMSVTAGQLKGLAPPGEQTPIKVMVDPLGNVHRREPLPQRQGETAAIDPRVMAIAREAVTARSARPLLAAQRNKRRQYGSWSWMRAKLEREGLGHLVSQLSAAIRLLRST